MENWKHWDSAYLHQGISYHCRDMDPDPRIRIHIRIPIRIRSATKIYSFVHWPIASVTENFMEIRSGVFAQLITNKQRRKHNLLGGGKKERKQISQSNHVFEYAYCLALELKTRLVLHVVLTLN